MPYDAALERRKLAAWRNAKSAFGYLPEIAKLDEFNALIAWSEYGNRDSEWGWELDHIIPLSLGGLDVESNLRALHWRNNVLLGGFARGLAG